MDYNLYLNLKPVAIKYLQAVLGDESPRISLNNSISIVLYMMLERPPVGYVPERPEPGCLTFRIPKKYAEVKGYYLSPQNLEMFEKFIDENMNEALVLHLDLLARPDGPELQQVIWYFMDKNNMEEDTDVKSDSWKKYYYRHRKRREKLQVQDDDLQDLPQGTPCLEVPLQNIFLDREKKRYYFDIKGKSGRKMIS